MSDSFSLEKHVLPKTLIFAGGVGGARFHKGFYDLFYGANRVKQSFGPDSVSHERNNLSGITCKKSSPYTGFHDCTQSGSKPCFPSFSPDFPLHAVINTGDDFAWMGLKVCPDLDTNLYTLAELNNEERGWGLKNDTWSGLSMLKRWPENPCWFNLGDADLAFSLERTLLLREGLNLAQICCRLAEGLGLKPEIWPMCLEEVTTYVDTYQGSLPFQEYFVKQKAKPLPTGFTYKGLDKAKPLPHLLELIQQAQLILIAPSNPFVSILPILGLAGIKPALQKSPSLKIAISPLEGGRAFKGPLVEMLKAAQLPVSASGVAHLYRDWLDIFVMSSVDAPLGSSVEKMGIKPIFTDVTLSSPQDRSRLTTFVLDIAQKFSLK